MNCTFLGRGQCYSFLILKLHRLSEKILPKKKSEEIVNSQIIYQLNRIWSVYWYWTNRVKPNIFSPSEAPHYSLKKWGLLLEILIHGSYKFYKKSMWFQWDVHYPILYLMSNEQRANITIHSSIWIKLEFELNNKYIKCVLLLLTKVIGPIMNLISGIHDFCERKEYTFNILLEYNIITCGCGIPTSKFQGPNTHLFNYFTCLKFNPH